MELLPLGPIVVIDTAGLDDIGDLGKLRVEKTNEVNDKTDLAVLVFSACDNDIENEKVWFKDLKNKNIAIIGVINKIDLGESNLELLKDEFDIPFVEVSSKDKVVLRIYKLLKKNLYCHNYKL
jgi:small GTP-binding protein